MENLCSVILGRSTRKSKLVKGSQTWLSSLSLSSSLSEAESSANFWKVTYSSTLLPLPPFFPSLSCCPPPIALKIQFVRVE